MTLAEFEQQIFAVAMRSSICDIPAVRRLTSTSISLRISIASGGFVDAFYNEQTDTMAFAFIREGQRLFGVDNTGGWHIHPFSDPASHDPLADPLSFAEFVDEIEQQQQDIQDAFLPCNLASLPGLPRSEYLSGTRRAVTVSALG